MSDHLCPGQVYLLSNGLKHCNARKPKVQTKCPRVNTIRHPPPCCQATLLQCNQSLPENPKTQSCGVDSLHSDTLFLSLVAAVCLWDRHSIAKQRIKPECTPLLGASSNLIRSVLYCVRPQSTTVLPAVLCLKLQSTFHTPRLALSIRHHLQGHMRCTACGTHAKGQFTLIATPPQCCRWVQRYLSQQVNKCSLPGHSAISCTTMHARHCQCCCMVCHSTRHYKSNTHPDCTLLN